MMIKRIFYIIILFVLINAFGVCFAETMNYSIGLYGGVAPALGGTLNSYVQETYFGVNGNGVDGINRSLSGYSTDNIDRLTGTGGGIEIKGIFFDYYLLRIGANYFRSVYGGSGTTLISDGTDYYLLDCEYTFTEYDFPVTLGVCIPFWKDMRLSLSAGAAYAKAKYTNNFKSEDTFPDPLTPDPFEREGTFKAHAIPLVAIIEGEYFVTRNICITSALSYYWGTSEVVKDSTDTDTTGIAGAGAIDYARIDFSGYRYTIGVAFYIFSI